MICFAVTCPPFIELRQGYTNQSTLIMRNEIEDRHADKPIIIEQKRQQRTSLIVKDVGYAISAVMILKPVVDNFGKYIDQFERKVERGQCHHTPHLGAREFAAWFEPATGEEKPTESINPPLGQRLFDSAYKENGVVFQKTKVLRNLLFLPVSMPLW